MLVTVLELPDFFVVVNLGLALWLKGEKERDWIKKKHI